MNDLAPPADFVVCPRCDERLDMALAALACASCGQRYPRLGDIPVLFGEPDQWMNRWRLQLALLEKQGAATLAALEAPLAEPDLLASTRDRCRGMLESARAQIQDVMGALRPVVTGPLPDIDRAKLPPHFESPLHYIHYLYRDWAWESAGNTEIVQTLALLDKVIDRGRPLGRTLVLGAGACRLAYELHRRYGGTETAVVDIDALLFTVAHAVVRGARVPFTEATLIVQEMSGLSRTWMLAAPDGPLDEKQFRFFLADGLDPPFAAESFDTVITPWFIDQVPPDVRDLLGTLDRLLRPGGRWINFGPLLYPNNVPLGQHFTCDELTELAACAGLRVQRAANAELPYLVSPHNKRGKVEWLVAFEATKDATPTASSPPTGAPAWLLLPHLPVPRFMGHALFHSDNPMVMAVMTALDDEKSINDLCDVLAAQVNRPEIQLAELKQAVRHCLANFHPDCRPPA